MYYQMIALLLLVVVSFTSCQSPPVKEASLISPSWVWGQKLTAKSLQHNDKKPTSNTKPFLPFSEVGAPAGPVHRKDGTTKTRITDDAFLGEGLTGLEEGYTTIDILQKESGKGNRGGLIKVAGSLGGLDPEEVYYADEDLLILKGGGFQGSSSFDDPPQEIDVKVVHQTPKYPPWKAQNPPSQHEEYNGNIPAIVPPPLYKRWGKTSPTMSLFLPAQTSQSIVNYTFRPIPISSLPLNYNPLPPYYRTANGKRYIAYQNRFNPIFYVQPYRFTPHRFMPYPKPSPLYYSPYAFNRANSQVSPIPNAGHPLHGDTDVNYLNPKPEIDPDAEFVPLLRRSLPETHPELDEEYRAPPAIRRTKKPKL